MPVPRGGNAWLIVESRPFHAALFLAALWQNRWMMPILQRICFRLKSDPGKVLKKEGPLPVTKSCGRA
jgi:hypothetical protein